jgi:hypothetical protein
MKSNKYSSYFNNNFNFNNIVQPSKSELDDNRKNMTCDGNIMLEPRLQEYLKKKRFLKQNTIEPCISPEKEFQITSDDIRLLKRFLRGDRNIYDKDKYNSIISSKNEKQYFPSKNLRNDPRVPDIEKLKVKKNTPANMGMFVPEGGGRYYENSSGIDDNKIIDSRDFPKFVYDGSGFNLNETRFNPRIDPKIEPGIEENNKYDSQYRIPPDPYKREVDPDPRNKYILTDLSKKSHKHKNQKSIINKTYDEYDNMNSYKDYNLIDQNEKIIPQTRYGDDIMPSFSSTSEMDMDNKLVIPNIASKAKKELNSGNYRFETYFGRGGSRDTELESDLVRGMPSSRPHNRSYGYRNPQENYYDYLDPDFQNPELIEPWIRGGEATRTDNKNPAKNKVYNRVVM